MGIDVDVDMDIDRDIDSDIVPALRVQSTQIWSTDGFSVRNCNYSLGYVLHV